ncbi:MAG: 23S rRNA (pseudouridine(1915)-N(3))-methyltransferase RlmH [Synergistaceae bacterium]|jgi:23S rRNA (pseudouridine1915-N3)-methyltransferase|nr:23S rRNA (pseudouridine(1915)-N(3))-methyltransferase RlmH [Synergistaceae bacterium]
MKILILAVGKLKDVHVAALSDAYLSRMGGAVAVERVPDARVAARDGPEILRRLRPRDRLILLSEDGAEYDSRAFASFLSREVASAEGRVVFAVGGPWGVSESVRQRADSLLSLSRMTFPHDLCFLFLTEQIYRALTILDGGGYSH